MLNKRIDVSSPIYVLIVRGDGLKTYKNFFGAYDLIYECGGDIADLDRVINALNAGRIVSFGTLRVCLA